MHKHNRRSTGAGFELYARSYLERQGYTILYTNLHLSHEEIDIVAQDADGIIHLVEVRSKSVSGFGLAIESIGQAKKRSLLRSAALYMSRYGVSEERLSIDLITFDRGATGYRLVWYPNIDLS